MATMQERVAERYPSLLPLLKDPEIGKLLTSAVTNNWSPGVFQSKFIASKWFRSQSESSRRWWVLSRTDPGEAKQQLGSYRTRLGQTAGRLGVKVSPAELTWIATAGLTRGWEPDGPEIINDLVALMARKGERAGVGPGAYNTTREEVRTLASRWMRTQNQQHFNKWSMDIIRGSKTIEDLDAFYRQEAIKRFPHMKDSIAMGATVSEVIAPYVETVAEELEINPTEIYGKIKANDPVFRKILMGVRDPKTNRNRMLTDSEVIQIARERSTWFSTMKGRQMDASMTQGLLAAFGKRK